MSQGLITFVVTAILIILAVVPYLRRLKKKEAKAKRKFQELKISGLSEAATVHPHIDVNHCIGCGGCVKACPEGDVLAIIEGKATLIHGAKCVGHGLCADACPVGAIQLLMAKPGRSADLPALDVHYQTNIEGVFIVGELGGIGLIKNAVTQGKSAVEHIITKPRELTAEFDLAIVGAGPAGLAAGLTAKANNLNYVILEQSDIGGSILHYPRAKIVMTSPVELPIWGKLKLTDAKKETLLEVWQAIIDKAALDIRTNEKVLDVQKSDTGFVVRTSSTELTAANVILALGRRGTPKKLGVPGEELSKVMYRLIDTSTYQGTHVLIVGGGDSAVEAAAGLALQKNNTVTLSYRREAFTRLKERNLRHVEELKTKNRVHVIFNSEVKEIRDRSAVLTTPAGEIEMPNDFVFIFAGGEMPFELLRKIGVRTQMQEIEPAIVS